MPRQRVFFDKRSLSFCVEGDVYEKFRARCEQLGVLPSEVLREFVASFVMSEPSSVKRTFVFNISLNIEKIEKTSSSQSGKASEILRQELLNELRVAVASTKRVISTSERVNIAALNDRRRYILKLLRQVRDIPDDLLAEVKKVLGEVNEMIKAARRL